MSTITTEQAIPTGTWTLDTVHSTVGYAVRHSGVSLFKGPSTRSTPSSPTARSAAAPTSRASPSTTRTCRGTCSRPTSSTPSAPRASSSSRPRSAATASELTVEGELEIRGARQPITLTGTIAGPVEGPAGERIGLTLETVIDRTSFGMNWNMELPGGGFILDNEVTLTANLEFGKAQA